MKVKILIGLVVSICFLVLSTLALATPSLGVASNVAYIGETGQTGLTEYQDYFVDTFIPGTTEQHGFAIPSSGKNLTIWAEDKYKGFDIWLVTDATIQGDNIPKIDGNSLNLLPSDGKIIGGYKPLPYYGIKLNTFWSTASLLKDFPGSNENKSYYGLDVKLEYSGSIASGQYFFAMADIADFGTLTKKDDVFSPKTDSATGYKVSEPGMLALLGMGLVGIGIFRRRK